MNSASRRQPPQKLVDVDQLKARLRDRIDDLVHLLFGNTPIATAKDWRLGSIEGDAGASCSIVRIGPHAGSFTDFNPAASRRNGDVLDLIALRKGMEIGEAIRWAAGWVGLTSDDDAPRRAGSSQMVRKAASLWNSPPALNYLHARNLTDQTIKRFQVGIAQPYTSKKTGLTVKNALTFPLMGRDFVAMRRFAYYEVPGFTENAVAKGWGPGAPATYFAAPFTDQKRLLVAEGPKDLWLLAQQLDRPDDDDLLIISSSHGSGLPEEWKTPAFWASFETVYLAQDADAAGDAMARAISRYAARPLQRVRVPDPRGKERKDWTDFFLDGGTAADFRELLHTAPPLSLDPPKSLVAVGKPDAPGDYEIELVNVNGAFVNGHMYYPFEVEAREVEITFSADGGIEERFVQSYKTKVLRSDATIHEIIEMPSPKGTPKDQRVLALTDGTRISMRPRPNKRATWPLRSINGYIRARSAREAVARPLSNLLSDLTDYYRRSVWLPYDEDYAVVAVYTALSFVYQIFAAIPLLLVTGEKGTGKSELGEAIDAVAFNSVLCGAGSAASVIRTANESRGLVVLDDLEAVGQALQDEAFTDLHQMLKLSYKRSTGKKLVTDKHGRVVEFDFYGPKVINNTLGVDPITASRMYEIRTRKMPTEIRMERRILGFEPETASSLRCELHAWAMSAAAEVAERYRSDERGKGDRFEEISLPLRILAEMSGNEAFRLMIEAALHRQANKGRDADEPADLLREAVTNCVRHGARREISLTQIMLELRISTENGMTDRFADHKPIWQQAWWISNQLSALQLRDEAQNIGRRRLWGRLTKLFPINAELIETVEAEARVTGEILTDGREDPFAFCTGIACSACPYETICDVTADGLRAEKQKKNPIRRP